MADDRARLIEAIVAQRKYRAVSRDLVERLLDQELRKPTSSVEKVKAVRNKIHQVVYAFQEPTPRYDRWLATLQTAFAAGDRAAFIAACRDVMRHHASTRERLPILSGFYQTTLPDWSDVHTVVDVGCGLNPLAIPLLGIRPDTRYFAYDVLGDLVDFLNALFPMLGVPGQAELADVVHRPETLTQGADLALLLKLLPCLEQVEKGAAERLIDTLQAKRMLVSFPVHTLGGARKGLGKTYEEWFLGLVGPRGFTVKRFEFRTELAFIVSR